ncbi:MAG: phasin family protein [Ardenticatenaceae bacterium]|nr:phasin family protein [Anaerolineales bacterium]MCB8920201.1 phasin family protein [Ardenticatenaceae bacterium]MCB9004874.1 phasin family protein [Ardenticatenaceae bacterium]
MIEEMVEVQEEAVEKEGNPMLATARRVLLAGIGVVALAQGEVEDFINRLIERGEIAEKDGRKLLTDVLERRKKQVEEAETELESRIEEILNRMNIPSKADIDALSRKITNLTKKVDELKKS